MGVERASKREREREKKLGMNGWLNGWIELRRVKGSFPKVSVPSSFGLKSHSFRSFADQICNLLACSLLNFDAKLATDDKGETATSYWGYEFISDGGKDRYSGFSLKCEYEHCYYVTSLFFCMYLI